MLRCNLCNNEISINIRIQEECSRKMINMTGKDRCFAYFVKVSLNINLILFICATFPLSSFLLLSSLRIIIFSCFISSVLARNYRQHFFLNAQWQKKIEKRISKNIRIIVREFLPYLSLNFIFCIDEMLRCVFYLPLKFSLAAAAFFAGALAGASGLAAVVSVLAAFAVASFLAAATLVSALASALAATVFLATLSVAGFSTVFLATALWPAVPFAADCWVAGRVSGDLAVVWLMASGEGMARTVRKDGTCGTVWQGKFQILTRPRRCCP